MNDRTTVLLDRWHDGDLEALEHLVEQHLGWIRARVHDRIGEVLRRRGETGDFVQDALVEFLRYGPRIRIEDGKQFRGLLARIAENVLRGEHRWWTARRRDIARERPLPATSVLQLSETPSQVADAHEREAWIRLGLELLSPEDREVVVLRSFDSLEFAMIAQRLGLELEAARKRYYRAVRRLAAHVAALRRQQLGAIVDQAS